MEYSYTAPAPPTGQLRFTEPPPGVPILEGAYQRQEEGEEVRVYNNVVPRIEETVHALHHVQHIERIVEKEVPQKVPIQTYVPKVEVTERTIEIKKPVKDYKIVEVPQVHVIDKIVEKPEYICKEKIVERPRYIIQERIIPIPKRRVEEKTIEVDPELLQRAVEQNSSRQQTGRTVLWQEGQTAAPAPPPWGFVEQEGGLPVVQPGPEIVEHMMEQPSPITDRRPSRPVDKVVEVPHIQKTYRSITKPVTRPVAQPVEVSVMHYRPRPVERIVDRNVPIPVELEVIQEFLCPRVRASYQDVPVPVTITRAIEKPVPADAMFNQAIMDAYLGTNDTSTNKKSFFQNPCSSNPKQPIEEIVTTACGEGSLECLPCSPRKNVIKTEKLSDSQLKAAGINSEFKSRGQSYEGFNMSRASGNFFS